MAGEKVRRKKELDKELQRIVAVLKEKYKPEKIILYGSFAQGQVHEWSDLDIVVVKRTNKRFYDRLHEVSRLADSRVGADFLVYTPQEFKEMSKWNYFIRDEVVKKGRVLYETS